MSKAKLKKELENLDAGQLRAMILDAYDANAAFKEYFEFFLNPDVKKLREKYFAEFTKEAARQRWGRSRMRVTKLKKGLKEFMGYKLGAAEDVLMMFNMLRLLIRTDLMLNLSTSHYSFFRTLLRQMREYGDTNECADLTQKYLTAIYRSDSLPREIRWIVDDELGG